MTSSKYSYIYDSPMMAGMKWFLRASSIIFIWFWIVGIVRLKKLYSLLKPYTYAELAAWGCISVIFDNNNSSSLHLLTISSMYYFRNRSLPITAPKCLCSGDVIFMLVLLNISAAFDLYSDLTINFVLPGFGKYPYFGPTSKSTFHQLSNFYNLLALAKTSAKPTILGSPSG